MNNVLSRLVIAIVALPLSSTAAVVARYTFEEGQNGAAAVNAVMDSSGNAFHGVPINRPVYTSTNQPNSALALRFDGRQRVMVAHRPQLELHKSFVVEASIFIESCPPAGIHYQIVFQGDTRPGNDPITLTAEEGCRIEVEISDNQQRRINIVSRSSLQTRAWHRVQALLDDSSDALVLLVNGIEEGRRVTPIRASLALDATMNPGITIGATATGTQGFVGIIDDVLIRNDAAAPGVPRLTRIVNGASFAENFTSSSWLALTGSNLAAVTRQWNAGDFRDGRLPTSLEGVSVTINGRDAPVFYISPSQVNVLAPRDEALGTVEVVIRTTTGLSRAVANLARYAPAFFLLTPPPGRDIERRYGVVTMVANGVSRLIGPAGYIPGVELLQAVPGDVITFWATGLGPTEPVVPTDRTFSGAAPLRDAGAFHLRVGDVVAEKQFVGMVSNGLFQLNIVVPNLPPGEYRVVAEIGGSSSSPIWLAIGERRTQE